MNVPTWWEFVLLALAAYRLWRIVARDSITEPAREALTGYDDEHAPSLAEKDNPPRPPGAGDWPSSHATSRARPARVAGEDFAPWRNDKIEMTTGVPPAWRVYLSALIRCPWCLGFWISWAAAGAWWAWPHVTLVVAFPFALSAVLGLVKKNLDV